MEISLKIKIGDVVIELDERDARSLYWKLGEMFGSKRVEYWWSSNPQITYYPPGVRTLGETSTTTTAYEISLPYSTTLS